MSKISIAAILAVIVPHASAQQGPPPGSSGPSGGGTATCSNPSCASPPCAISLLGDCGCTSVSGTALYEHELIAKGGTVASNAHIFGPFEAGFTSMQDSIIENWGCTDPSLVYDSEGGTDIGIAEKHVAHACGITFPRIEGDKYYGAVGYCGGHTSDYHFHRAFACLYTEEGAHSTKVGDVGSWNMYGKWEDFTNNKLPYLDACGGHLGMTPESPTANVYHYHAQDVAPGTVGCHGPSATGGLVSIAVCRSLYPDKCTGSGSLTMTTADGDVPYDRFCPCFDATGSNVGTVELPALTASDNYYVASSSPSPTPTASSPSPSPTASTPTPTASSPSPSPTASTPTPTASSPSPSPTTIAPGVASWAPEAAPRSWSSFSAVSLAISSAVALA